MLDWVVINPKFGLATWQEPDKAFLGAPVVNWTCL